MCHWKIALISDTQNYYTDLAHTWVTLSQVSRPIMVYHGHAIVVYVEGSCVRMPD